MIKGRGFTLIEAVMVIAIIGILSVSGAYLMLYLIQNSVFIPNKMNMDMVAGEALDIMIEGDSLAKGLRFSRSVTNSTANQVSFINQDNQAIVYRLDTSANKLYRSISAAPEVLLPYYASGGINISGKSGSLFTYYDANENLTSEPANVRRVKLNLIASTGSGNYTDWEGRSEALSAVAIKKFQ